MGTPSVEQLNEMLRGYDRLYGLELVEFDEALVRARVQVREELCQPMGPVHGGVYASLAESMASLATALAVMPNGDAALGLSNNTSFMRPITHGTIHASAAAVHRGRTTWVWEVRFTDDEGRLCSITRMTVAVRRDAVPAAHA